jgi:hypothetical protein
VGFRNVIFLAAFPFLISSCATNNVLATGDDFVGDELCGSMVDSGEDPCQFLREINLYSAVRHEEYNDVTRVSHVKIDGILKNWVIDNDDRFLSKKINAYHKSKRPNVRKSYGPEHVVNVYFWSVEVKDKDILDIIFLSRSMHGHIVTSRQCDLGNDLDACLSRVVNDLLDRNVSGEIFKYTR